MASVTLSTVVDLSKIKMKWKEQYVSEGLNRKITPFAPRGIYSGLKIIQNTSSPRQVEISSGGSGIHSAVHENSSGYSTTYFDPSGSSIILDLSSASLDSQEVVVTLYINYTIGVSTAANWIAYPVSDWDALSSVTQNEHLVLGTVNVPAPATNITTAMILPLRRTMAWENQSPGSIAWSPIVENSDFSQGKTGSDGKYQIPGWINDPSSAVNGSFSLGTTYVRSGAKSLEFNKTNVAASTCSLAQSFEIPVVPGQYFRISAWVKQAIAPTGGAYQFVVTFGDSDSSGTISSTVVFSAAGTDASFRNIDKIIEVPSGYYFIKKVEIQVSSITAASTGLALTVDDFQVYVESQSAFDYPKSISGLSRTVSGTSFVVEDSAYSSLTPAAVTYFDSSSPANEGTVSIERRDQDYSGSNLPPAIAIFGRILNLGSKLLGTEASSLLPRASAKYSAVASVDFTLVLESARDGETAGSYTRPASRFYVSENGGWIVTVNATWDGSAWNKDVSGTAAFQFSINAGNTHLSYKSSSDNVPWNDSSWTSESIRIDESTGLSTISGKSVVTGDGLSLSNTVMQLKAGNANQAGLLLDVQSIEGRSVSGFDPFGGIYRRGSYFFEEFDTNSLNDDATYGRWVLIGSGSGATGIEVGTHEYKMQPASSPTNYYRINTTIYKAYQDRWPRFRCRIRGSEWLITTKNAFPFTTYKNRVLVGFDNLYLDAGRDSSHASHANLNWYLNVDGTYYDTGIPLNYYDDGTWTYYLYYSSNIYISVTGPSTVVVAVHGENESWTSANMVTITTLAPIGSTGRVLSAGIVNEEASNPSQPTLYVDYIEAYEALRADFA